MALDMNGKVLIIGDKVHPIGRGYLIQYIIEIGKDTVGVNSDKNAKHCYGVYPHKLVKMKKQ